MTDESDIRQDLARARPRSIQELEEEIKRLELVRRNLKHSLDELREIQDLARTIRSSSESGEILAALCELMGRVLPEPELGLYLTQGKQLVPIGDPSIGIRETVRSLAEEDIINWVLEEGRPISVPDLRGQQRQHSDLLVPLIVMKSGIGILLVRSHLQEEELTAQQLDLVSFASGQAAMALENARLVDNLRASRQQLEEMLEGAADLILKLDGEGRIRYANSQTSLLGESRERLIGRSLPEFLPSSEERDELTADLKAARRGWHEWRLSNPALSAQAPRVASVSLSPILGGRPGEVLSLAILRDQTDRKLLELQAREAEKLHAVMLAAVTVNHEINNPLTAILGNLFMIRREVEDLASPELLRRLETAERSAQQIELVAQQLEKVNEIKLIKYLGDTEMLDIDMPGTDEEESVKNSDFSGEAET